MSVIWESKLDGKYDIVVARSRPSAIDPESPFSPEDLYTGTLTITEGQTVLFSKEVSVSYGAVFGPDIADVQTWQNMALDFIDAQVS